VLNLGYQANDDEDYERQIPPNYRQTPQTRRFSLNDFSSASAVPTLSGLLHEQDIRVKFGEIPARPAVVVKEAIKAYGKHDVLQGLNMTVPEGTM